MPPRSHHRGSAPSGDAGLENEHYDADRVRFDEALLVRQRRIKQTVVAMASDGSLAGHTQLVITVAMGLG